MPLWHSAVNPVIGEPPSPFAVNATPTAPADGVEPVTVGACGTVAGTTTVAPNALNGPSPWALVANTRQ